MDNNKFKNGTVKISNDIFYMITAMATMETEGVKSVVGLVDELERVTAKNSKKGIEIDFKKEGLDITIKLSIEYGKKIDKIVEKIQENIRLKIEVMTGIKVISVNVIIDSIEK